MQTPDEAVHNDQESIALRALCSKRYHVISLVTVFDLETIFMPMRPHGSGRCIKA